MGAGMAAAQAIVEDNAEGWNGGGERGQFGSRSQWGVLMPKSHRPTENAHKSSSSGHFPCLFQLAPDFLSTLFLDLTRFQFPELFRRVNFPIYRL
jgi:hypothetical protein